MKEELRNTIRTLISEEFKKKSIITEIFNLKGSDSVDRFYKNKKEELVKLIRDLETTQNRYTELDSKFKSIVGSDFQSYASNIRKRMEKEKDAQV